MKNRLLELFRVDLRSLALFRVALGLLLLVDLVLRLADIDLFYSEVGVFPKAIVLGQPGAARFSLHTYAGQYPAALWGLFGVHAIAALSLVVGFWTRTSTFVCWFLLASLHARTPGVRMSGDSLIYMLFLWGIFVPLGARASWDAMRSRATERGQQLLSIPGALLLLQIAIVYWSTAAHKSGDTWMSGSAVFYALHLEEFVTPLGRWLREQTALIPVLTYGTLVFEYLGPFLAFSPVHNGPMRTLAVFAFWGFHLSLAVALEIGFFPLYATVGWLAFLPAWFWERLADFLPGDMTRQLTGVSNRLRTRLARPGAVPLRFALPKLTSVVASILGLLTFSSVLSDHWPIPELPGPLAYTKRMLPQNWKMFAPDPPRASFVGSAYGVQADGQTIAFEREGQAWVYYYHFLVPRSPKDPRRAKMVEQFGRALCRHWNDQRTGRQRVVEVTAVIRFVTIHERYSDPPGEIPLLKTKCAN